MGKNLQSSEWKMIMFSIKEGRIGVHTKLIAFFFFQTSIVFLLFPLASANATQEHKKIRGNHAATKQHNIKVNPKLQFEITLHGILLWVSMAFLMPSMAFLMPIGILAIRLFKREGNRRRLRIIFYLHSILQKLAVLLATAGAITSIKNFKFSFTNNHQRLGVALYGIIWLQVIVGIVFRPQRGSKGRSMWFFLHWIIGTSVSLLSVINVYLGLQAYQEKTSRSIRMWNILFTVQISLIVFFYLLQEKWIYIQNQGVVSSNELPSLQEIHSDDRTFKAESL